LYCRVLPGNTALDDEFTTPGLVQSERAVQFLGLLLFRAPVVDGREPVAGAAIRSRIWLNSDAGYRFRLQRA
jgi:hypothetical protein